MPSESPCGLGIYTLNVKSRRAGCIKGSSSSSSGTLFFSYEMICHSNSGLLFVPIGTKNSHTLFNDRLCQNGLYANPFSSVSYFHLFPVYLH